MNTIEWLQNGRQPGAHRGADRRDAYKRTILSDPRLIDALPEEYAIVQDPDGEASDWNRERIAIFICTDRPRERYFYHARCAKYVYEEIAALLNIKKGTVQKNIERSLLKMKNRADRKSVV